MGGIANCYNSIGTIEAERKQFDKALVHCSKALKIFEGLNNKDGIANTFINLGSIYREKNDLILALEYFNKAAKINTEIKDNRGTALALVFGGRIYETKGNMQAAKKNFNEAYGYAKLSGEIKELKLTSEALYLYEKKGGNKSETERAFQIYSVFKDSLEKHVKIKLDDYSNDSLLIKRIEREMHEAAVSMPAEVPDDNFFLWILISIILFIIAIILFIIFKSRN